MASRMSRGRVFAPWLLLVGALVGAGALRAQPAAPEAKVVVSGTVPDEATRAAIVAKVRALYGAERVVDQLGVGDLVAPPNWAAEVQKLIGPDLRLVSQGQLRIDGNVVELVGSVANEAQRQELASRLVNALGNPTYTLRNGLRVAEPGQEQLNAALARRTIGFESGNAVLTSEGRQVLDGLLPLLRRFNGRRFQIVGHTDADGARADNIALSLARAEAVKAYLVAHGIAAAQITTSGAGPDDPVADNATAEGRARNRRIEFRVLA